MVKPEKGTPKEIANRCKSKGLQKLRWFCQMCQKQCRDQNGFKCHLTSEAHQRQLLLFAENSQTYLHEFSVDFERNFLRVLKNTFGTKRVRANEVYQEYIRDKIHVHMNSTKWHTLTNFVLYLGSSGICRIDHTERGWYIALIDQEEELRREEAKNKAKADINDAEHHIILIEKQAQRAREHLEGKNEISNIEPTELLRQDENEKIAFELSLKKPSGECQDRKCTWNRSTSAAVLPSERNVFITKSSFANAALDSNERGENAKRKREFEQLKTSVESSRKNVASLKPKKSALDEIMEMEERKKEKQYRRDYWLHEGIIVKILTKKLGSEFYKAKGTVQSVIENFSAMIDVDDVSLKIHQDYLETVIPVLGGQMLVVNGAYRGTKAILEEIKLDEFSVKLRLIEGLAKDRIITVAYEDACKMSKIN